jgi:hypothetical protein
MARRLARMAWAAGCAALLAFAAAQPCPWPDAPVPALAALVRAYEPLLPRRVIWHGVDPSAEHADDLRYLHERGVLTSPPSAATLTDAEWVAALRVVAGWTGAAPPTPAGGERWRDDLQALSDALRRSVRPLALVAWDEADRRSLAFLGLVWNYSAYPRLIVSRPDPAMAWDGSLARAARTLDNCAFAVHDYVAAAEGVARALFTRENQAVMYIVASEPDVRGRWPAEIPAGEEVDVFSFEHPLLEDVTSFAAVFVGDAPPIVTFLKLLPRVRTSLWPTAVPYYLATPPRAR